MKPLLLNLWTVACVLTATTIVGVALLSLARLDLRRTVVIALAPIFGLAGLVCVLTTANWVLSAEVSTWVVFLPVLIASSVVALRRVVRERRTGPRPGWLAPAVAIGACLAVVGAVHLYPAAMQRSVGPAAYQVWDGPNYAITQTGLTHQPVLDKTWGPKWSRIARNAEFYGPDNPLYQQIGVDAVIAHVAVLTGRKPVTMQYAFMISLVLIGALGAFAFVLHHSRSPFLAWLGSVLAFGPVVQQMLLDGSEGAVAGVIHLLPLLILCDLLITSRAGRRTVAATCLLAASAAASYPVLFLPIVAAAGVIAFAFGFSHGLWRDRRRLRSFSGVIAALAVGTAVGAPFAFERSLHYWKILIEGGGDVGGLPAFDLPLPALPGYVFGTREFYALTRTTDINAWQWLLADVIPVLLALLVCTALIRYWRRLWPVAVLVAVFIATAVQVNAGGCDYCMQRSLLPLGPLLGALIALGIGAVGRSHGSAPTTMRTVALGAVVLVVVGHTTAALARRGAEGAWFMPYVQLEDLQEADNLPEPVLLEGIGNSWDSPGEMPASMLAAGDGGLDPDGPRTSVVLEANDFQGLAYLGAPARGTEFAPDYRSVVTRLGMVRTDRRTIRRRGSLAVQRRTAPFDVTVASGLVLNRPRSVDHRAFLFSPMLLLVSGPPQTREVGLRLEFGDTLRSYLGRLPPRSTVRADRRGTLHVCVPVPRTGTSVRRASIPVKQPVPLATLPASTRRNRPIVIGGPWLASMTVGPACRRR